MHSPYSRTHPKALAASEEDKSHLEAAKQALLHRLQSAEEVRATTNCAGIESKHSDWGLTFANNNSKASTQGFDSTAVTLTPQCLPNESILK